MVHPARVERATSASGGQRSIQLSYGCIYLISLVQDIERGKYYSLSAVMSSFRVSIFDFFANLLSCFHIVQDFS
jgi:hypothetical protein